MVTEANTGRRCCGDAQEEDSQVGMETGVEWVSMSKVFQHQKLEESESLPLEPSDRAQPSRHLDQGLLVSRNVRK